MRCARARAKLADYVSGELAPTDEAGVREHLVACESCRMQLAAARRAHDALLLLREDDPTPDVLSGVRQRLDACRVPTRPRFRYGLAAFGAVVVALLILGGWLWSRFGVSDSTPVARESGSGPAPVEQRPAVEAPREPAPPKLAPDVPRHEKKSPPKLKRPHPPGPRLPKPTEVAPRDEPVVVREPDTRPLDSEPMMLIVFEPRAPEIRMVSIAPDGDEPGMELTVVREFDASGRITSVSIDAMPADVAPPDAPEPGASTLLDVPPANTLQAEIELMNEGGHRDYA